MLIQLADYWNELLRKMCVNSARLFSPLKVYHAKNGKNKLFGCRFVPNAWAIWLYHSIRIRPSDPREYAQTLLDWNLNFISILNCGIDILSVSDPDLEIKGSGGGEGRGGWGSLSIWSKNKGGLGPSTGSATACIGLINEFLIDSQRGPGDVLPYMA